MALTTREKQLLHTLKEAVITDVCNALATPNLDDTNKKILRDIISEISYREHGTFEARKIEYAKKSLIAKGMMHKDSTFAPTTVSCPQSSLEDDKDQPF